jgi:hypothetical protein
LKQELFSFADFQISQKGWCPPWIPLWDSAEVGLFVGQLCAMQAWHLSDLHQQFEARLVQWVNNPFTPWHKCLLEELISVIDATLQREQLAKSGEQFGEFEEAFWTKNIGKRRFF